MLEWLIGAIAGVAGVSPLVAVGFLVAASVGASAALRWHRSTRQDEYFYLNLTQQLYLVQTSGVAIDPFTLQPIEDPRLRPTPATGASEPGSAERTAPPRRGRPSPRVVVRRAGSRRP
ncbi:MAG TPA: hypothetical protein VFG80_08735 [Myxococcota bacterium]|nr:hypothetical protein [Myxococcota bacterium]